MARSGERKQPMFLNVGSLLAFMRIASGINDVTHGPSYCHFSESKDSTTKYGVEIDFEMAGECKPVACKALLMQIGEADWDKIFTATAPKPNQCKCSLQGGAFVFSKITDGKAKCDGNFCWTEYASLRQKVMSALFGNEASTIVNDIRTSDHWEATCLAEPDTKMPPLADLASSGDLSPEDQNKIKELSKDLLTENGKKADEDGTPKVLQDISGTYTYKLDLPSLPSTRTMFVTQTQDDMVKIIFAKGDGSPVDEDIQGGPVAGNEVAGIAGGTITISGSLDPQLKFTHGGNKDGVWVRQAPNDCKDLAMVWKGYESKNFFIQGGLDNSGEKTIQSTDELGQTFTKLASEKSTLSKTVSDLQENYKTIMGEGAGRLCSLTEKQDQFVWGVSLAVPMKQECKPMVCNAIRAEFAKSMEPLFTTETIGRECDCSVLGNYLLKFLPTTSITCSSAGCLETYIDRVKVSARKTGNEVKNGESLTNPDHWDATCDKNGVTTFLVTDELSEEAQSMPDVPTAVTPTTADYGDSQDKDVAGVDEGLASAAVKASKGECSPIVEKLEAAKKELDKELNDRTTLRNDIGILKKEIEDLGKQNVKLVATFKVMGVSATEPK